MIKMLKLFFPFNSLWPLAAAAEEWALSRATCGGCEKASVASASTSSTGKKTALASPCWWWCTRYTLWGKVGKCGPERIHGAVAKKALVASVSM